MSPGDKEWTFGVRANVAHLIIQRQAELKQHLFLLDCEVMDHLDEAMQEWSPEEQEAAYGMWVG